MSLLKSSVESPPIIIPFKVRLEPYLVESLCDLARLMRDKGAQNNDLSGLLFGKAELGVRSIEGLKTFADTGAHSELARRQRWEKAYKTTADEAKIDPELSQFEIVGWFSFRTGSGLLSSDLTFHNQHFRNTEDLALILWRDGPSQMTAEVYSKSENDTLTSDDYRWGSVRLSADIRHVSDAVELAMRTKLSDDSYLRTYESDEPLSSFETLKLRAEAVSDKLFGFLKRGKEEAYDEKIFGLVEPPLANSQSDFNPYPDVAIGRKLPGLSEYTKPTPVATPTPAQVPAPVLPPPGGLWPGSGSGFGTAPARIPERIPEFQSDFRLPEVNLPMPAPFNALELAQIGRAPRTGRSISNEIGGVPMLFRPPVPQKASPWPWTIGVFLLCSGLVFGFLALGGLKGENGRLGQMLQSVFPGSGLNLRVRNDDDRLRLSWNQQNHAVASASDATLQIFDGQLSREIHLDGRQVADGSVLYRPLTNDITFRLVVRGDQGSATGSVRLLDGLSSRQATLDVSSPLQNASSKPPDDGAASPSDSTTPMLLRDGSGSVSDSALAERLQRTPAPVPSATGTHPLTDDPLTAYVPPLGTPRLPTSRAASGFPKSSVAHYETPETIGANQQPNQFNGQTTGGATINGWDPAPVTRSRTKAHTQAPLASGFGDATKSTFVAPRPLVQVMPNVRSIPPGTLPERSRVAVKVSVDTYGRVTNARVTGSGVNAKVAAAAVSAAKQWMFDPAKENGRQISSEHTIVFVLPAR